MLELSFSKEDTTGQWGLITQKQVVRCRSWTLYAALGIDNAASDAISSGDIGSS